MAVFLNNHVALLKNIFRMPKSATLRYLKGPLTKKLKNLPKHLNHYQRFAPQNYGYVWYSTVENKSRDMSPYASFMKIIGDIFEVKVIWRKSLGASGEIHKGVIVVGYDTDVTLFTYFLSTVIFTVDDIVVKETERYNRMVIAQRRKRQRGVKTEKLEHSRVYSRKFKESIVRYINTLLLEILDRKKRSPNYKFHYQFIEQKFKLKADKRGNPNWNGNYDKWEKKTAKNLKFQNNKLLN